VQEKTPTLASLRFGLPSPLLAHARGGGMGTTSAASRRTGCTAFAGHDRSRACPLPSSPGFPDDPRLAWMAGTKPGHDDLSTVERARRHREPTGAKCARCCHCERSEAILHLIPGLREAGGSRARRTHSVFERSVERFAAHENASKYKVRASVLIQSEPIRL